MGVLKQGESQVPVEAQLPLDQEILGFRHMLGQKGKISDEDSRNLRRLYSLTEFNFDPSHQASFLTGDLFSITGTVSATPKISGLAKKNLGILQKKYDLEFLNPDDVEKLSRGEVTVIGAFTKERLSEDDVKKLEKCGLFLRVQQVGDEGYRIYIYSEAGYLLQLLADHGISFEKQDSSVVFFNKHYLPKTMSAEQIRKLSSFVDQVESLQREGKYEEVMKKLEVMRTIIEHYTALERITFAQRSLEGQPEVKFSAYELTLLRKEFPDDFDSIFGFSFEEFKLSGASLNLVAEKKLELAKKECEQSIAVLFGMLGSRIDEGKLSEINEKQSGLIEYQLRGASRVLACMSIAQESKHYADEFHKLELHGGVQGKTAISVMDEEVARISPQATASLQRMGYNAKLMAFYYLLAESGVEYGDAERAELANKKIPQCMAQISATVEDFTSNKTRLGKSLVELDALYKRILGQEKEFTDFADKVRGAITAYTSEVNPLSGAELLIFEALAKDLGISIPKDGDPFKSFDALFKSEILDKYDPYMKYVLEDELSVLIAKLGCLMAPTWRYQSPEERGPCFLTFLNLLENYLSYSEKGKEPAPWSKLVLADLRALQLEFKGKDLTRDEVFTSAIAKYDAFLVASGERVRDSFFDDALAKLATIEAMLDDDKVAPEQKELISAWLRSFESPEDVQGGLFLGAATGKRANLHRPLSTVRVRELLEQVMSRDPSYFLTAPLLMTTKPDPDVAIAADAAQFIQLVYKYSLPARLEALDKWYEEQTAMIRKGTPQLMVAGSRKAGQYKIEESYGVLQNLGQLESEYRRRIRVLISDGISSYNQLKSLYLPKADAEDLDEEFNGELLNGGKFPDNLSTRGLRAYAQVFIKDVFDPAVRASFDKLFEDHYEKRPWYERWGAYSLRFLQRHGGKIMTAATVAGVVAGILTSGGLASEVEGAGARAVTGSVLKQILKTYGPRLLSGFIAPRAATALGPATLEGFIWRGAIGGFSLGGKAIAVIGAVPLLGGATGYLISNSSSEREKYKSMLGQGLSYVFLGTLAARGSFGLKPLDVGIRSITLGSEILVLGGTSLNVYATLRDRPESGLSGMDMFMLAGDALYLGLAFATPFLKSAKGFFVKGLEGYRDSGLLRGVGRGFKGATFGAGAELKTIYWTGVKSEVQFGDVLIAGTYAGDPFIRSSLEKAISAGLSPEQRKEFEAAKKTRRADYLLEEFDRSVFSPLVSEENRERSRRLGLYNSINLLEGLKPTKKK